MKKRMKTLCLDVSTVARIRCCLPANHNNLKWFFSLVITNEKCHFRLLWLAGRQHPMRATVVCMWLLRINALYYRTSCDQDFFNYPLWLIQPQPSSTFIWVYFSTPSTSLSLFNSRWWHTIHHSTVHIELQSYKSSPGATRFLPTLLLLHRVGVERIVLRVIGYSLYRAVPSENDQVPWPGTTSLLLSLLAWTSAILVLGFEIGVISSSFKDCYSRIR